MRSWKAEGPQDPGQGRGVPVLLLALAWLLGGDAKGGTATEDRLGGGVHVLHTDATSALHTLTLSLGLPFGVGLERIDLVLGFGTREEPEPNRFLDALSLSLQPPGVADAAFLVTADARGWDWLPPNPGGLAFPSDALTWEKTDFPWEWEAEWPLGTAFVVSLLVPRDFQDCCTGLVLDLFDNREAGDSFGFVQDIHLVGRRPYFLFESAASPVGPYAVEMGVTHSEASRQFELMAGGVARFFRLRADSTVNLEMKPPDPSAWRFAYTFPEPQPLLEGAAGPGGPFTVETNAVLEASGRRFRLPTPVAPRFFRVRANVRTRITSLVRAGAGNGVEVAFEYRPQVFSLQSSAQPCGPFADDPMARFDTAAQTISVSRTDLVRFFRVVASSPHPEGVVRMRSVERTRGGRWVVGYEVSDAGGQP